MNLQRLLIRAMLWMLAITAVAGVFTIFGSSRVMGRVAGTAALTAFAMIAAFPVSKLLDRDAKRQAGLVGLLGIVVSFVLGLGAIWIGLFLSTIDLEERLGASSCVVFFASLLACAMVNHRTAPAFRLAATFSVIADALAAVLFLAAIWDGFNDRLGATGGTLLAAAAPAALAMIAPSHSVRAWRWIAPLAALVSFVLAIAGIWFIPSHDPTLYNAALCVAYAVGHANIVMHLRLPDSFVWLRLVAIASASATAAGIAILSYMTQGFETPPSENLARITGAAGIVASCGTIALVVLLRLNPPRSAQPTADIAAVALVCPHCSKKFEASVGTSACPSCGLLISIAVREPLCHSCQYPLLDLKSANCPECGTPRTARPAEPSDPISPASA